MGKHQSKPRVIEQPRNDAAGGELLPWMVDPPDRIGLGPKLLPQLLPCIIGNGSASRRSQRQAKRQIVGRRIRRHWRARLALLLSARTGRGIYEFARERLRELTRTVNEKLRHG